MHPSSTADVAMGASRLVRVARAGRRLEWLLAMCAALVVSRWVLYPRYLITFDEINFAFSIDHFDPRLHQPQPPGYPVFVALLKILSLVTARVEMTFFVAGVILSAVSLIAVWWLGELMCGRTGGILGAALLLFNPVFWLAALTNPVRLCFAAGAISVGLCMWLAWARAQTKCYVIGAVVLGLSAGARPSLALMMAPLMLWVAWRIRLSWKTAGLALLCFCAAVATWLPALLAASGGLREFLAMLRAYSHQEISGTSALFGARLSDSLHMAWEAVAWSLLGALSWLWCVPAVMRKREHLDAFTSWFLALWFVPGLLFYAMFHVGDPDHTLSIVPATCVAGAAAITALTRMSSPLKRALIMSACVLLNVGLFLKPISVTTKPATYKPVRWLSGYISDVIEAVGTLRVRGEITAVFDQDITGWRQLSYYYRHAHVIVLMKRDGTPVTARHITGNRSIDRNITDGAVYLPGCGVLAWIDPTAKPLASGGTEIDRTRSYVYFASARAGESFQFRGLKFIPGAESCGEDTPPSASNQGQIKRE